MALRTGTVLVTCVFIFAEFRAAFSAGSAKPVLTVPAVATVHETATQKEKIATGIKCSDADKEDQTRIFMTFISPDSPCGKCFVIWPDGKKNTYSLWYNPREEDEKLSFTQASEYVITVQCTDDENSAIGRIVVKIVGNSPPIFTNPKDPFEGPIIFRGTVNQQAGAEVYDADADDVDGDAVFYTMNTVPDRGLFEIGWTDGIIRASKDLRFMCEEIVDFYITASDDFSIPGAPHTVQMDFKGGNIKPEITTKKNLVEMDEDLKENKGRLVAAMEIKPVDATKYDDLKWNMWAEPERGLEYYYLDTKAKARIRTRTTLNYEYAPLRSVKLFLNVTDGFCVSDTYSITVDVIDINEPPVLEPQQDIERIVYEGLIEVIPGWKAIDPDENEQLKWEMDHKNFYIDSVSGIIYSIGEFDIDPNTERQVKVMDVKVIDKEGKEDKRTLKLIVIDKNDNAPAFTQRLYHQGADECTPPGSIIGKLNAVDKDSNFQGNSLLTFGGGGVNVTVMNTGQVVLNTPCKAGQTETFSATVSDQGTYPGPLKGTPATIIFKCNVCPPTAAPVTESTPDPCEVVNASEARCKAFSLDDLPSPKYPNSFDPLEDNLGWLVPACILALILLALLIYMLWRYCCRKWLAKRALIRMSPYPRKVMPRPKQVKKPPPKKKEPPPPKPTPPELPPENEPEFFGFWKEAYVDRDQRHMPKRDVIPLNVQQDNEIEKKETEEAEAEKAQRRQERQQVVDKYNQEMVEYHNKLHGLNQPPPRKKKRCTIL